MSDSVRVSLRIPPEVFEEIARESRARGESLSDNMRRRLSRDGPVKYREVATMDDHERRIAALEEMANHAY
jgi:negative regulator of replication initiation